MCTFRHHDVVVLEDELQDAVGQYEYDEYTNTQVCSKHPYPF